MEYYFRTGRDFSKDIGYTGVCVVGSGISGLIFGFPTAFTGCMIGGILDTIAGTGNKYQTVGMNIGGALIGIPIFCATLYGTEISKQWSKRSDNLYDLKLHRLANYIPEYVPKKVKESKFRFFERSGSNAIERLRQEIGGQYSASELLGGSDQAGEASDAAARFTENLYNINY